MPQYIFDPDVVHAAAMTCIGQKKPEMFDTFADALEVSYPGILDRGQPWIYSIAGGAMIQMKLYFASMHEYIMVWGTPIGSDGHSGRHVSGFWDTVVDGECWYFAEGEFEKTVYKPGDRIYVGPGQARAMNFKNGVYAVEYARGFIPASLPFGIADELLSCWDWVTAAQTFTLYADLMSQDFGRRFKRLSPVSSLVGGIARKLTNRLVPPPEVKSMPKENIKYFR